ncbi:MAG TPA: peptide chain release factor N(5)-glutamine methyltransferase [Sphingomicrobium sp.]|nr:peptide chain release factor N(5)-glutamine methyltransferase [Sphingomicrobium sp.]
MNPLARALADAARQLSQTSDTARLDAELLMAEALDIERDRLILDPPDRDPPDRFWAMVKRREAGEPVAYITGRRAFWNIELHVGPGVLIPRPDSEVLISAAIEHFEGSAGPRRVLDLGTGPGTLLLAALDLWPEASGIGVDFSLRALSYAQANARRLGLAERARFGVGNWAENIDERFELLLCNPPYVARDEPLGSGVAEHEPAEALFAGPQGLDSIRAVAPQVARLLAPGGLAAIEIGASQGRAALDLLVRDGLGGRLVPDLAGHDRAVLLTWV